MNTPQVVDSICLIDDDGDISHCFVVVSIGSITRLHMGEFNPDKPKSGLLATITTVFWKIQYGVGGIKKWMKVILDDGTARLERVRISIENDQKTYDITKEIISNIQKVLK